MFPQNSMKNSINFFKYIIHRIKSLQSSLILITVSKALQSMFFPKSGISEDFRRFLEILLEKERQRKD